MLATLHRWNAIRIEIFKSRKINITNKLPSKQSAIGQAELILSNVKTCKLTADIYVNGSHESKMPALTALSFFDKDRTPLVGPFSGISQSSIHGPYVYLGKPNSDGLMTVNATFPVPEGAAFLEAKIYRWSAKEVNLINSPRLSIEKVDTPITYSGSLGEIDIEVQQGETYEIQICAPDAAPFKSRFAIVIPRFFDINNEEVPPTDDLPVSKKVGPYRYLAPSKNQHAQAFASASIIAPAKAIRMHAEVLRWQGDEILGMVDITAICLQSVLPVWAEGRLNMSPSFPDVVFSGELEVKGEFGTSGPVIEVLFESSKGKLLLTHAEGLEQSERFINFASVDLQCVNGRIPFHFTFKWPLTAQWLIWRLRSAPGQILKPIGEFELKQFEVSPSALLAELPASAKSSMDLDLNECDLQRSALFTAPFWDGIARKKLQLLGEVICSAQTDDWIAVSFSLKLKSAFPPNAQINILPIYFDCNGSILALNEIIGCIPSSEVGGLVRFASAKYSPTGQVVFREAFLTPQGAAFAAFYVLAEGQSVNGSATTLAADRVDPEAVHAGLDTTQMNRSQIEQAIQIAEQTGDIPVRQMLAVALASLVEKDQKLAHRAHLLTDRMTELDPEWLPPLPIQPAYDPDPTAILHLFKVIYPDESTGGAVRSTAIVDAQAAKGLRPIVCMPLNSPRSGMDRTVQDGIIEIERNGVRICYPYYRALSRKQIRSTDLLSLETVLWNRTARAHNIGLIHAASGFNGYENALKGVALARANNLPLVYEVRSFHEHTWRPAMAQHMSDRLTRLRMAQEDRCMAAADAVVTISQAMIQNLFERGVPKEKLFFVPNAIDPIFETLPPRDEVILLRDQYHILNKTTIGYISNFSQREGHQILLDAFTRLIADGHDLHLVMVGDGPERSKILHEVESRKLVNRVVMPGNIDHSQIRTWYHAIDLFVVPRIADFASDYVTPLKPFEAMSQGVPLIMSDRPVTAEIAGAEGKRATVFPAGDCFALAQTIKKELADQSGLVARAEITRKWIMEERVWSSVVQRYDDAYEGARKAHADRKDRIDQ
ncbi:glycosyltransferase family 4 protein [Brucella anthropi]|uniref:glycosyltransferase family 4 protein n=1 Tax=Brucella anthropi TaxID=529 RepID=UPI00163B27FA|nr:glycosyltransferase family 4 protein [Brucella anthropi]